MQQGNPYQQRGWLIALVVLWSGATLMTFSGAFGSGGRNADLAAASAIGGLVLAILAVLNTGKSAADDASPEVRWGSLPLFGLLVVPILYAIWFQSLIPLFLVIPAAIFLATNSWMAAALLPRGAAARSLLVFVALYLAFTPAAEGLFLGPPKPEAPQVSGDFEADDSRSYTSESGSFRLTERLVAGPGQPSFWVVTIHVDEDADLQEELLQAYVEASTPPSVVLPFVWFAPFLNLDIEEAKVTELADEWKRILLVGDARFVFEGLGNVHDVIVLHKEKEETRPSLLPFFYTTWETYAGVRLDRAGDYTQLPEALRGHLFYKGQALDVPDGAFGEARKGTFGTPGFETFAVAVAVGSALLWARRGPSRRR